MTFQLTTEHKHYVNAAGDKCEVALLNGVWVAVWDSEEVTQHNETGELHEDMIWQSFTIDNEGRYNITAPFKGWLVPVEFKHGGIALAADENGTVWELAKLFKQGYSGWLV